MRMEQLRCLVDIAETHSLTATAQRLYMTQQAVSKNMKYLEQELGVKLLVRTNVGVQLTEAGEGILSYAKQILESEKAINLFCEQENTEQDDYIEVKICSASSVTNIVLPNIVSCINAASKNIAFRIEYLDNIDALFRRIQERNCVLGILTYNAQTFPGKFAPWEDELQMETLALDDMLMVTDKKFIKDGLDYFPMEEYDRHVKTLYNILSTDETKDLTIKNNMTISSDADFHRRMIDKAGAIVTMSGISYQYFFSGRKYIGLPLENHNVLLAHMVIYRKDVSQRLQELIALIRREMYIK